MSDEKVKKLEETLDKETSKVKYYRNSKYASGSYIVKMADLDPTEIVTESFKPVREKYQGDDIFVGYMATSTKSVQKRCEAESFCEEISKAEYEQAISGSKKKK